MRTTSCYGWGKGGHDVRNFPTIESRVKVDKKVLTCLSGDYTPNNNYMNSGLGDQSRMRMMMMMMEVLVFVL